MTHEEAQEAVDNGDTVTASELMEMYTDKTLTRIEYDMATENAEMELAHKIEQKYEFNEPRMAAKQGRKTCHSGPKGVLTDYEEAKLKMRALRLGDKIRREQKVYMNLDNTDATQFGLDMELKMQSQSQTQTQKRRDDSDNDQNDDDSDDA